MDLAHNPSAISFALERFGLKRTVCAVNWYLSLKTMSLDPNNPGLNRTKIPEIITRLVTEADGQTTQEQVTQIIQERNITDDYFTDSEREEYMVSVIKDRIAAIAAHIILLSLYIHLHKNTILRTSRQARGKLRDLPRRQAGCLLPRLPPRPTNSLLFLPFL